MGLWLEKSWTGYLIISLLAVLCAPWLLPLIKLGDTQIITFFKLLIVGLCLNAHTNVSYEYLLADNRYGAAAGLSVAVLFILCLSYFPLVEITGPYAIGWAWIVSQSLYAFVADALVIRTGGEFRISNFLLWQSAYSELFFLDVYWPDFRRIDLWRAIRTYQSRDRRIGK